jgi:GNAT superfamily N-acetyltransferase
MTITIRPYSPDDREAIRHICCETGFSGNPIDPIFSDREVFADFLTRYYTDWEPESSFVAVENNQVIGYIIGCIRYKYHSWANLFIILQITPKVLWRFFTGQYNRQDRKFLKWSIFNTRTEVPKAPSNSAHLHFNLLPEYRNSGLGVRLFFRFMKHLKEKKVPKAYGQIQTFDDKRTERAFNKYGFYTYDRHEITKFCEFLDKKIYVSTVVWEASKQQNSDV